MVLYAAHKGRIFDRAATITKTSHRLFTMLAYAFYNFCGERNNMWGQELIYKRDHLITCEGSQKDLKAPWFLRICREVFYLLGYTTSPGKVLEQLRRERGPQQTNQPGLLM